MSAAPSINPWSSRVLVLLFLALSFLVPYSGGVLVEKALIDQWQKYGFAPEQTLAWWENGILWRKTAITWRAKGFAGRGG
jgi:hypothetical protein